MLRQNVVHMWHQNGTQVNMDVIIVIGAGVQFLAGVLMTLLNSVYRWEVAGPVVAFNWIDFCVYV